MAKELGFKPRSLLRRPAIAAAALEGARRGVGPRPVCQTPTPQRAAAPATRTHAAGKGGPDKRRPFSGHSDNAGRHLMTRQRHGKNCPPRTCKRCYHTKIWI